MKRYFTAILSIILCCMFIFTGCGEEPISTDPTKEPLIPTDVKELIDSAYEATFGKNDNIEVTYDILIPSEIDGVKIKFRSNNTNLVGNDGSVFRREATAQTTATITLEYDGHEVTKTITIIVIGTGDNQSTDQSSSSESSSTPIVADPIENKVIHIADTKTGYPKIAEIRSAGEYTTVGIVSAVSDSSFVIRDETGCILVSSSLGANISIGDTVVVSGNVIRYAKAYRFDSNINVEISTAVIQNGQSEPLFIDAAISNEIFEATDINEMFVEVRGVLRDVNGTSTLVIANSTKVCSIASRSDLSEYYNNEVTIKGYLTGVNSIYLQVVLTEISISDGEVSPSSIAICGTDNICVGESFRFASIFAPASANISKRVIWSSSDEYVAKVDCFGNVYGISAGSATITATLQDGTASAQMSVTIIKSRPISATSISYDGIIRLKVGDTLTISPKVTPSNANTGTGIKYEIDDDSVASITSVGVVSANAEGSTKITMTLENGYSITAQLFVSGDLLPGYSILEIKEDTKVYPVENKEELYTVIDEAITKRAAISHISSNIGLSPLKSFVLDYYDDYCRGESFVLSMFIGEEDGEGTYRLAIDFCIMDDYGAKHTELSEKSLCNEIPNALTKLRETVVDDERNRRSDTFENFPICVSNNGSRTVYNTEELVWALSRNYMPIFPVKNTKAEYYFNEAKDILRQIITYDMNDAQKVRAIFDYVCEHTAFDFDMAVFNSNRSKYSNVHLESAMEDGYCLSEGMTKMFVMLCRMDGIEAVFAHGYDKAGIGNAWSYAKIDGEWYAFSLSKAQGTLAAGSDVASWFGSEKATFTNYAYFGTRLNLFDGEYSELQNWRSIDRSGTSLLTSALSDMWISSTENAKEEIKAIFSKINNAGISGSYFATIAFSEAEIDSETLYTAIFSVGISGQVAYSEETANGITFMTVFVNTEG